MYIDNIIRDIKDLIHDVKDMEDNVNSDRKDVGRVLANGDEAESWKETAKTFEDGLLDAQNFLQNAEESLYMIHHRLGLLLEQIAYEQLSAKIMGK